MVDDGLYLVALVALQDVSGTDYYISNLPPPAVIKAMHILFIQHLSRFWRGLGE